MQTRHITVRLNGIEFVLKYEAENLLVLSRITNTPHVRFIQDLAPRQGENEEDVGVRCSDLSCVVPLLQAGMAHMKEYKGKTDTQMQSKICALLDAEAEKQQKSLVEVCAGLMEQLVYVVSSTLLPPGQDLRSMIEQAEAEEQVEEVPESPLDAPSETSSPPGAS